MWPSITHLKIIRSSLCFIESGSSPEHIKEAISYGVIKMNIDTDTNGLLGRVHTYYNENKGISRSTG